MTEIRLRYQTVEFSDIAIHVCTLRSNQEFHDPDGAAEKLGISSAMWSLFGVIWPSGFVLAHFIHDHDTRSKRILEIGCGIALSSLLLHKQEADITATDYHPEANSFLQRNASINDCGPIAFEQVGWKDESDGLGRFDMIIGSDVLYEDEHVELLANFIARHANQRCEVILVDPGRGRKTKFSKKMQEFGFTSTHEKPQATNYLDDVFKGYLLRFVR